jgi:hypothetical protein
MQGAVVGGDLRLGTTGSRTAARTPLLLESLQKLLQIVRKGDDLNDIQDTK